MATKKQIAQVMKSAINEAVNFLNMKPPTSEDMYKNPPTLVDMHEHALGVKLGEGIKAQIHKDFLEAQAKRDALFRQLENIEPIPIQIAKAIQAMQSRNDKGDRHERAKGVTDKWIAQQFSQYAQPLIARCYPICKEGDEENIREEIIPNLKRQRRIYVYEMIKEYGGLCVYEPMRGGDKSGYATVGKITSNGIKKWIRKYRDESNPEPKSGFHVGMLKDKKSIEEAAKQWGNYWHGYALAFLGWRKTHSGSPRNQFRYKPQTVIHGAEYKATTAPQS